MIEIVKEEDAYMLLTQLLVLYFIFGEGAGVDTEDERAYGVWDI